MLLAAALVGAGTAAAKDAAPPAAEASLPATILVLDGSSSMVAKLGSTSKVDAARAALGQAVGAYGDRLSFGLVAFGHRKASNCADSEILAKPGELTAATQEKLLGKIEPKGQAPIAAALSDAAKGTEAKGAKLDIVLIADGGDTCDADICATAAALKQKSQGLRIHVIGFDAKADGLKPLSCIAGATGGTFVTASNANELKQGLATILDAIALPAAPSPQAAATAGGGDAGTPEAAAEGAEGGIAEPPPEALAPQEAAPARGEVADGNLSAMQKSGPSPAPAEQPAGETAVLKSTAPPPGVAPLPGVALLHGAAPPAEQATTAPVPTTGAPPVKVVQSVAIAPPPLTPPPPGQTVLLARPAPAQAAPPAGEGVTLAQPGALSKSAAPQVQLPVPVTFQALVTEAGPKLQSGLTWRVYADMASSDGSRKLLSTHHEAMPTAALLPGDYLVNAAYGLSNLTKKIKVESGRSLEETFVLNTGGLKLAAVLGNGEPLPEGSVRFDIQSDEEDQFGNRHTILGSAKPGVIIRLNAGAYHVASLYGDANATVRADVTVEPGKITEATVKQTGAKTTFKLVQTLGGEALADTKWTILTSAGDVVKENAGALPTHILAAGSYAVVADHNGSSYTRKFSIEQGEPKQIEVVVDDGPTTAEALKALTDPPAPPPPSSGGTYAGEGAPSSDTGAAFDGFSAPASPADPNAPLINPGALFRPSTR
ncbi:MAG TPA: VWA domain-containing protein [Methyloceanibacter sp.]|nr:VWA domain-containing protein [Methyloceanibacter sp.]